MKLWKSLFAITLVVCMLLTFAACAGEEKKEAPATTEAPTTEEPTTEAPTTEAPTAEEPTTEAPTTEPTTEPVAAIDPAHPLLGEWVMPMDMTQTLVSQLGESMDMTAYADRLHFVFDLVMIFEEDGTCTMKFDEEKLNETFADFVEVIVDITADQTYAQYEAQGMDKATVDAQFQSQVGMDMRSYLAQSLASSLDVESLLGKNLDMKAKFKVEGEKLYLDEKGSFDDNDYAIFSIDGDTMLLDASDTTRGSALAEMARYGVPMPWTFTRK
ncbi:MAG: hypothetical protein E7467_02755 [Ruminococcaceae bacterium]|nr:hypothetical protein [Oscillospiraceae bacterium]